MTEDKPIPLPLPFPQASFNAETIVRNKRRTMAWEGLSAAALGDVHDVQMGRDTGFLVGDRCGDGGCFYMDCLSVR